MSHININSAEYDKTGRAGMGNHTPVHRIVFVRHGETEANHILMKNKDINYITLDTPLTPIGLQQGEDVAIFLNSINFKPNNIYCSKLQRAYDTALPTIIYTKNQHNDCNIELSEEWIEFNKKREEMIKEINSDDKWLYKRETYDQCIDRVFKLFEKLKNMGSIENPIQTIIFTHSQVIAIVLSKCLSNTNKPCEDFCGLFQISNGSITCIDIDEIGIPHIQTVNYTKHLSTPTGQHTPFV